MDIDYNKIIDQPRRSLNFFPETSSLPIIKQPLRSPFPDEELNFQSDQSRKRIPSSDESSQSSHKMGLRVRKKSRSENDSGVNLSISDSIDFGNEYVEDVNETEKDKRLSPDGDGGSATTSSEEFSDDDNDDDFQPATRSRDKPRKNFNELQINLPFLNIIKRGPKRIYVSPETLRISLLLLLRTNIAASQLPNLYQVLICFQRIFLSHFFR